MKHCSRPERPDLSNAFRHVNNYGCYLKKTHFRLKYYKLHSRRYLNVLSISIFQVELINNILELPVCRNLMKFKIGHILGVDFNLT